MAPLLTQPRRSRVVESSPKRTGKSNAQNPLYPAGATLAQISVTATATTRSRALADSVRRNARSGLAEIPRIDICGICPWLVLVMSVVAGTADFFMIMV